VKSFFVGLLVLAFVGLLSFIGVLLMPLLLVLGLILKIIVSIVLVIFAVWLLGKITLVTIENLKKREKKEGVEKTGNNIPSPS